MAEQAYETVIAEIETMIRTRRLGVGDRLEGERALAARLGVSRTSVREAIRILTVLGIVRSAPGSGPTAGAQLVARPETPLTAALRLHIAAQSFGVVDVVRSRALLETGAYRQITQPVDAPLRPARELVDQMDQTSDPAEFIELDTRFHLALVELAGNALLTAFMSSLRAAIADYIANASARIADWPRTAAGLQREHRAILDAIAGGEGPRAADLVEAHIWSYARLTILD